MRVVRDGIPANGDARDVLLDRGGADRPDPRRHDGALRPISCAVGPAAPLIVYVTPSHQIPAVGARLANRSADALLEGRGGRTTALIRFEDDL